MENLRNATLVFLIKKQEKEIKQICLAMKKRGFGVGKWNGVGGKEQENETPESAATRETKEEIFVDINNLEKVGEISFYFINRPDFNQKVHIYFCEDWSGEPKESEEMSPMWFDIKSIPFEKMWEDDIFWLPKVISGDKIIGTFVFDENNNIIENKVISL